jgi:hypothetical protein
MNSQIGQCSIQNPADKKAPPKSFTFDGAYFTDSTTEQIYADIGFGLVEVRQMMLEVELRGSPVVQCYNFQG